MLVFVDVDPLKWNRFVSLIQQLLQFGSRYWVYSVSSLGSCTDASEKGFPVREGCRELASEVDQGSREAPGPSVPGHERNASSGSGSVEKPGSSRTNTLSAR